MPLYSSRAARGRSRDAMPGRSLADFWPVILLAALAVAGLAVEAFDLVDWREALARARGHAAHWWLPPALVLLQVVLYLFGLPGSTVLWLVAPLYPPLAATAVLAAGGVGGALAAYAFARRLSGPALARLRGHRAFRLLERETDFLFLCALRLVPAFPHSVLNYGAGVLRMPLMAFLGATAIGFAVKAFLYASAIHHALEATEPAQLLRLEALLPLVALAAVLLAARALRRRRSRPPTS